MTFLDISAYPSHCIRGGEMGGKHNCRRSSLRTCLVFLAVCPVVPAQETSWNTRLVKQWDIDDAIQVLTDSPWAKNVAPQWVRDLSPDERRAGGDWEADIPLSSLLREESSTGILDYSGLDEAVARTHAKPDPGIVLVRWESARPVRMAEQMRADSNIPSIDANSYYAIAVYNIAVPKRWNIERELNGIAALKRTKKKDLKPVRTIIHRNKGELATVVYLFPRSVEITKKDGRVIFQAQIGRLVVSRIFSTYEMQIQGQLEL
jgi:hypothetical protein